MIVYSAIVPHSPLLIPAVGKEKLEIFRPTLDALETVARELYASKPDVLLILTPHGHALPDAFTVNISSAYTASFEQFGDYETKLQYKSSPQLALQIKERVMYDIPLQLVSEQQLDHGTAVPLYYIAKKLAGVEIIPVTYSLLEMKQHVEFGELLKREIAKTEKRVAVLVSGNLSHCLTKEAPLKFSPEGAQLDALVRESVRTRDARALAAVTPKTSKKTGEDAINSLVILLGILSESNCQYTELAYQEAFGVGYLTGTYHMK